MSTFLAIDPGPEKSGWCLYDSLEERVLENGIHPNSETLYMVKRTHADVLALEMIASYGMPVGREVFGTCVWIGRFKQAWVERIGRGEETVCLVYRKDEKLLLCNSPRANDASIRRAIIDRFPATGSGKIPQIGTKIKPGPLYGIHKDAWAALAVAITANETNLKRRPAP